MKITRRCNRIVSTVIAGLSLVALDGGVAAAAPSPGSLASDGFVSSRAELTPPLQAGSVIRHRLPVAQEGKALNFVQGDCPSDHPYLVVDDFLYSVKYDLAYGKRLILLFGEFLIARNSQSSGSHRGGAWGMVSPQRDEVYIYCAAELKDSHQ